MDLPQFLLGKAVCFPCNHKSHVTLTLSNILPQVLTLSCTSGPSLSYLSSFQLRLSHGKRIGTYNLMEPKRKYSATHHFLQLSQKLLAISSSGLLNKCPTLGPYGSITCKHQRASTSSCEECRHFPLF